MMRKLVIPVLVLLAFSFSSAAFSQEVKKEAAKKEEPALKSVSCGPACGFMVRSHDEAELISIVKAHAKSAHDMDMTDKDVKGMMKMEKMKKKMEKAEKKM